MSAEIEAIRERVEHLERRAAEPGEYVYTVDHALIVAAAADSRSLLAAVDALEAELRAPVFEPFTADDLVEFAAMNTPSERHRPARKRKE